MPPDPKPIDKLVTVLDDALTLLQEYVQTAALAPADEQNPVSLLDQCQTLCRQQQATRPEPVRTIHHFACTGGTLLCKCIAAMPNTQLLSEVDPLSTLLEHPDTLRFASTDIVTLMRQSTQGASTELIIALFLNNLEIISSRAFLSGQRLVLRDHAHSHYCLGTEIPRRPTLREIISARFPTVSLVTVRHPVDSFLSLKTMGWATFSPLTFDEYCKRYMAFLSAYEGVPILRYEDFVNNPNEVMKNICDILELPFSDQFTDLFSVFKLTGDSGRSGDIIEARPRRPVVESFLAEVDASANYGLLNKILNYEK